jgi:hypothetical protein
MTLLGSIKDAAPRRPVPRSEVPSGRVTRRVATTWVALIAEQPDMTLDEIVAAMRKRKIAGSRSAVWRFFDRRNISSCGCRARTTALDA